MPSEETSASSHEIILKPFFEKADRIIRNLNDLEKEHRRKNFEKEISEIREKFLKVQNFCIPRISLATGHQFTHPNLFLFIFLYKEIKSLFNKAKTNPVQQGSQSFLSTDELNEMELVSKDRLTLAYIGDAALETGVLINIWLQDDPGIPLKSHLHNEREKLLKNEPLSRFWDSLDLYDQEILVKPSDESVETKGSFMEAVFGIIYLEEGPAAVEGSLHSLLKYYKQTQQNAAVEKT